MSVEIESIHRLHVVTFDSKNNISEAIEDKYNIDRGSSDTDHACNTEENLTPIGKNPSCVKIKSISDTSITLSKKRRLPVDNTNKHVFGKISFSSYPRSLHKRSVSIYDLKQIFSFNNWSFTNKIKQTFRETAFKTSVAKRNQIQRDYSHNESFINCLQMFESKKNNITNKIRNRNISRECRRLNLLYDSKSSIDFYEYNSYKNCNPKTWSFHLNKSQSRRYFHAGNFGFQNYCRDNGWIRQSGIPYISSVNSGAYGYSYTTPVYYNLIDCPCDLQHCYIAPSSCNDCVDEVVQIDQYSCVNEQVQVTPSCFLTPRKEAEECDIYPHRIVDQNIEIQNCTKSNQNDILKHHVCSGCTKPFHVQFICLPKHIVSITKSTVKCILFSLVVIAWSPCIVTLFLYLLIKYPLRQQNIFKDSETNEFCCQCDSCLKCRDSFVSFIFRYFVRVAKKVHYAYKTVYYFLNREKTPYPCHPQCNKINKIRKTIPNSKNKYILYFSSHRGWVMKSVSKRKKYCAHGHNDFKFKKVLQHPCRQKKVIYLQTKRKVNPRMNCKNCNFKEQKSSSFLRICYWYQSFRKYARNKILGPQMWNCDIMSDDNFVHTQRNRPLLWIYKLCPSLYPHFLMLYTLYKHFVHAMFFMFSICVWCPFITFCYFFYSIFCRCVMF